MMICDFEDYYSGWRFRAAARDNRCRGGMRWKEVTVLKRDFLVAYREARDALPRGFSIASWEKV